MKNESKISKHAKKYIKWLGLATLIFSIVLISTLGVFIAYKLNEKNNSSNSMNSINFSLSNISQDCQTIKNSLQKKSIIVIKTYLPSGAEFKAPEVQELEQK